MINDKTDYESAKERALAEYEGMVNGRTALSFQESIELREYAKCHTDLRSHTLTAEQAVWKALYENLTEELRKSSPDSMAKNRTD